MSKLKPETITDTKKVCHACEATKHSGMIHPSQHNCEMGDKYKEIEMTTTAHHIEGDVLYLLWPPKIKTIKFYDAHGYVLTVENSEDY